MALGAILTYMVLRKVFFHREISIYNRSKKFSNITVIKQIMFPHDNLEKKTNTYVIIIDNI